MTNATPHRFDDANPDTWCRCHNLTRAEIRTEIIVNSHNALVAALGLAYEALSDSDEQTETASAAAYDALRAAHDQLPCVCGDNFGICDCAVAKVTAALSEAAK